MSLRNGQYNTEEACRIFLDHTDSDEEDFGRVEYRNTDKVGIGSDVEEDQSNDQISDHGNNNDEGKFLRIIYVIYMHEVVLVVTLFYLLFRTQQLIDRRSYQQTWHGMEISEFGNCKC